LSPWIGNIGTVSRLASSSMIVRRLDQVWRTRAGDDPCCLV